MSQSDFQGNPRYLKLNKTKLSPSRALDSGGGHLPKNLHYKVEDPSTIRSIEGKVVISGQRKKELSASLGWLVSLKLEEIIVIMMKES